MKITCGFPLASLFALAASGGGSNLRRKGLRNDGEKVRSMGDESIREEDSSFLTGPAHRGNPDGNPATVPFLGWVKSGEQWWVNLAERLS